MEDSRSRSGMRQFYLATRYNAGSTSRNRAGPSVCRGIALSISDNYRSGDAERCNFAKLVRERAIVYKVIPNRSDLPASNVHVAVYSDASPGIAYCHGEIMPIADIVSFRQVNRTEKFILSRIPVSGLNSSVIRERPGVADRHETLDALQRSSVIAFLSTKTKIHISRWR